MRLLAVPVWSLLDVYWVLLVPAGVGVVLVGALQQDRRHAVENRPRRSAAETRTGSGWHDDPSPLVGGAQRGVHARTPVRIIPGLGFPLRLYHRVVLGVLLWLL